MQYKNKHIINERCTVRDALIMLDTLHTDAILFVTDDKQRLIGSLTDGDLRRGFIKGKGFDDLIISFVQPNPEFILDDEINLEKIELLRKRNFKVLPIVNQEKVIVDVLNFKYRTTIIPVEAVLMAGGEGARLRPLTQNVPKPLLKVGNKPIIEYNIDRLAKVGIRKIYLSINYLGEQIQDYFGNGESKSIDIEYLKEPQALGTIGSILLIEKVKAEHLLIMNSDLLTNIDFADFFKLYESENADMIIAATSYLVNIPYAVLECNQNQVVNSLKEKPTYSYYSNAGIYIMKKKHMDLIPRGHKYDITQLIEKMIDMSLKVITYPINGYWLDIGRPEDYEKAKQDIKHIKL